MGNTKHTPGPWRAGPLPEHPEYAGATIQVFAQRASRLADVHIRNASEEPARSNARLIAAAPELLEALKDLIAADDGVDHDALMRAYEAAHAAIAKAEGE